MGAAPHFLIRSLDRGAVLFVAAMAAIAVGVPILKDRKSVV